MAMKNKDDSDLTSTTSKIEFTTVKSDKEDVTLLFSTSSPLFERRIHTNIISTRNKIGPPAFSPVEPTDVPVVFLPEFTPLNEPELTTIQPEQISIDTEVTEEPETTTRVSKKRVRTTTESEESHEQLEEDSVQDFGHQDEEIDKEVKENFSKKKEQSIKKSKKDKEK